MELKNPFALYGERIITIHDLDISHRGHSCNCICPVCHADFEAKMGDIRQWHFAHCGTPCDKTILYVNSCYMFVRQILFDVGYISYPGLSINGKNIFPEGKIAVENVDIRYNSKDIAVGLIINNNQLALRIKLKIEYCVEEITKKIDDFSTLSINLTSIDDSNTEAITSIICKELSGKKWIYSKAAKRIEEQPTNSTNKSVYVSAHSDITQPLQKVYKQPLVHCKICRKTVHKDDAMWGNNTHGYICHKCIESNSLNWRNL